jgi:hypothetical protein
MRLINLPQGQAGVVWDHAWQGPHGHECQAVSTNYASYTILALNDLWLEGLELFGDNSLKRRVSNTINYLVLNEYDVVKKTYPSNICGDNQAMADQANLVLGDKPKTNTSKLVTLNLFELGRWGGLNNYLKTALSLVKKANPQYVQTSSGIAFLYLSRDELEGTAEFSAESHERLPAAESRARVRLNKPTQ